VTSRGQTVVPAPLRRRYRIDAGTALEWIDTGQDIRFIPLPSDIVSESASAAGVYLLDTSAVLALMDEEAGADRVEDVLRREMLFFPSSYRWRCTTETGRCAWKWLKSLGLEILMFLVGQRVTLPGCWLVHIQLRSGTQNGNSGLGQVLPLIQSQS